MTSSTDDKDNDGVDETVRIQILENCKVLEEGDELLVYKGPPPSSAPQTLPPCCTAECKTEADKAILAAASAQEEEVETLMMCRL